MFPQDQIEAVKSIFPDIAAAAEGNFTFLLIPNLKLPDSCIPRIADGLLCPQPRDGYPSRLFLSQKIAHGGKAQNWNPQHSVVILGRDWWAVSWKLAKAKNTLLQMIMAHLDAFRK